MKTPDELNVEDNLCRLANCLLPHRFDSDDSAWAMCLDCLGEIPAVWAMYYNLGMRHERKRNAEANDSLGEDQ